MKIVKDYKDLTLKKDKFTKYLRYKASKQKHQLWLKSRKSKDKVYIDSYDQFILKNLQDGKTAIFMSAGYYLEDVIENLTVIEMHDIVRSFYPNVTIINDRKELGEKFPNYFDNFIVINNRSDYWKTTQEVIDLRLKEYKKCMKNNCLFFYSFRDTQIQHLNRLKENQYLYFLNYAREIEKQLNFECINTDIKFASGDGNENPDTVNGNIKFLFKCIK